MLRQYLVGNADSAFEQKDFVLVEASNVVEAIEKCVEEIGITDGSWLEHIYSRSINMSFAEIFWIQGPEETGRLIQTGSSSIDEEEFNKRVREFFGEYRNFADKYLDFYWKMDEMSIDELISEGFFPTEMQLYMWHKSSWGDFIAIPLDEIEKIS